MRKLIATSFVYPIPSWLQTKAVLHIRAPRQMTTRRDPQAQLSTICLRLQVPWDVSIETRAGQCIHCIKDEGAMY